MPSITTLLLSHIPDITAQYATTIGEPSKRLEKIRQEILLYSPAEISIHDFSRGIDLPEKTFVTIDGGRGSQKLSGGDIIVAGAAVGEAAVSKQLYMSEEDLPAEAYGAILPHTSENARIEEIMMSLLELRLLAQVEADYRCIDGSLLSNVNNILYSPAKENFALTEAMLNFQEGDSDGYLRKAIKELIYPDFNTDKKIVALTKSDSAFVYNQRLADLKLSPGKSLSDRIIAARILTPGEFLTPRSLVAPRPLINSLQKMTLKGDLAKVTHKEVLKELLDGTEQALRRLDNSHEEEKSLIWTTYFKPSQFSEHGPVLKIEFHHSVEKNGSVIDYARKLISVIDQDLFGEDVLEPWSQYEADRRAKNVGHALSVIRNELAAGATTAAEQMNLSRNYRT